MLTTDDYIREYAERFGMNIGDADLAAIREKWESDPLCSLDDLMSGLRRLAERQASQMLWLLKSQ